MTESVAITLLSKSTSLYSLFNRPLKSLLEDFPQSLHPLLTKFYSFLRLDLVGRAVHSGVGGSSSGSGNENATKSTQH